MITSLISQSHGFAVAALGDALLVLRGKRGEIVESIDEAKAESLLAGCIDLEPIGAIDLDEIRNHLALRTEREDLLHATLIVIDSARTEGLRQSALAYLNESAASDQWYWIEGVLASSPFPEEVEVAWAKDWTHPLSEILTRLMRKRDHVKLVCAAWDALPEELFAPEHRSQVRCRLARQGVFRLLYTDDSHVRAGPFRITLDRFVNAVSTASASEKRNLAAPLHSSSLRAEASREAQLVARIWDVAPWRVAWLGSGWPTTRVQLACDAAGRWSDPVARAIRGKPSPAEGMRLTALYEAWHEVRHSSALTASIDLVSALSEGLVAARTAAEIVLPRHRSKLARFSARRYLPLVLNRFLKTVADLDPSGLVELTRAFFGMTQLADEDTQLLARKLRSVHELADATRTHLFAHCMQLEFDKTVPLDCSASAEDLPATVSAIGQFRSMLEVHALDQTFSAGGFMLVVVSGAHRPHSTRAGLLTACVDLAGRKISTFDGARAILLSTLRARLIADLTSGLPSERCGWVVLSELAASLQLGEESVRQALEQIARQVADAKFSPEALQTTFDRARLNPAATATPRA